MLNSREIHRLRPDVAANCRCWLERCRQQGLEVLITSTVRDAAYQRYLYEQGRSRPGRIVTNSPVPTFHADHAGLAFDFCRNSRGREYSDRRFFARAAELAKEMGFSWGGDWRRFPDLPHIQWDAGGSWSNHMIRRGSYPPPMPAFEEDETMTQETFDRLLDNYFSARKKEQPSRWSEEGCRWAEEQGLIVGDRQGEKAYRMFVTKEELLTILRRFDQQRQ